MEDIKLSYFSYYSPGQLGILKALRAEVEASGEEIKHLDIRTGPVSTKEIGLPLEGWKAGGRVVISEEHKSSEPGGSGIDLRINLGKLHHALASQNLELIPATGHKKIGPQGGVEFDIIPLSEKRKSELC